VIRRPEAEVAAISAVRAIPNVPTGLNESLNHAFSFSGMAERESLQEAMPESPCAKGRQSSGLGSGILRGVMLRARSRHVRLVSPRPVTTLASGTALAFWVVPATINAQPPDAPADVLRGEGTPESWRGESPLTLDEGETADCRLPWRCSHRLIDLSSFTFATNCGKQGRGPITPAGRYYPKHSARRCVKPLRRSPVPGAKPGIRAAEKQASLPASDA